MLQSAFAALAFVAVGAFAAPATTVSGPPVIYKTAATAPAFTATTLSAPAATVGSSKVKRDAAICVAQPSGISHTSYPDTAASFRNDTYYSSAANSAVTPIGFSAVFTNTGASPNADQYLGYTLLSTYDVQSCANQCNAITGCKSFNVYFERDPSVDPNDASCLNPPSVTNIKCVWWGSVISKAVNVNSGQFRGNFEVAIAGSNGYTGLPTQRGFRIKTGGSGTSMDGRWLAVSPGEGAAVALNPIQYKGQTSTFQFGTNGELLQTYYYTGMAGVSPNPRGTWDLLQYRAVGQSNVDYIKCAADANTGLVSCSSKSGFQYAGVCPGRPQTNLLFWGLPSKMPSDCKWIGLYVDTDISGLN